MCVCVCVFCSAGKVKGNEPLLRATKIGDTDLLEAVKFENCSKTMIIHHDQDRRMTY